jgi:hypothetical protein
VVQNVIIQYLESLGSGQNKLIDTNKHEYNGKYMVCIKAGELTEQI